jgi:predicted porin
MNRSIFMFAAIGGCAAFANAQTHEGGAVFTNEPALGPGHAAVMPNVWGAGMEYGLYPNNVNLMSSVREYSLEYMALADVGDPSPTGPAGAARLIASRGRRMDDGLQFYSPPVHGVSAGVSYSRDSTERDPGNRAWGISLGVALGPITFHAAHQNRHVAKVRLYDLAGNNMEAKNSLIAANMHFGWGTAYAAYSANSGWGSSPLFNPDNPYSASMAATPSTDSRDVLMGVAVPLGRSTTLLASFAHKNDRDRANRDTNELAIGASYTVARRTDFYAAYSYTRNLSIAGMPVSSADARGGSSSALSIGMRHGF